MSIDIPLVIDWHYIDTQLVSHWMSIGITLTVKYFNWQQIGIQLAMDWHRLYWIGIPYLSAGTSQKVRPQTWRLAVRLSWVWLAPDWVLISGHWRIIPAFALHWLNWHEFQFRTFELHWRWIGIITNPLPILVGFDWLGCIGLEKSGALYIWVICYTSQDNFFQTFTSALIQTKPNANSSIHDHFISERSEIELKKNYSFKWKENKIFLIVCLLTS